MRTINDTAGLDAALASSLPGNVKGLLTLRRDQLLHDTSEEYEIGELVHWIVVMPGDALPAIENAVNCPITPDPPWDWVLDHNGILEAPIILSDDGFGIVLIVPDEKGIDSELLALLRHDAVAAPRSDTTDQTGDDNRA